MRISIEISCLCLLMTLTSLSAVAEENPNASINTASDGSSSASGKSKIVQQIQDEHGRMYDAMIAKDLIKLQMAPAWWTRMLAADKKGVDAVNYNTIGIYEFAKKRNWGDLASFEDTADQSGATADERQNRIQKMLDTWKDKISVSFVVQPQTCDSMSFDLAMRYLTTIGEILESNDFQPPSDVAHVTLIASATAKDISVVSSPDGKHFTATAPVNHEPTDWGTKMTSGFKRLSKNRIK